MTFFYFKRDQKLKMLLFLIAYFFLFQKKITLIICTNIENVQALTFNLRDIKIFQKDCSFFKTYPETDLCYLLIAFKKCSGNLGKTIHLNLKKGKE